MKTAIAKLKSDTPITFGKMHKTPKLPGENDEDYELRTWRERCHYTLEGLLYIPGNMFGNCAREGAKFSSIKIPGKGKATYTKHFDAGIVVVNDLILNIKKDDVLASEQFVPSKPGSQGGGRVWKYFPIIPEWSGSFTIKIVDDVITPEVFEQVIRTSGLLVGMGTWRPRNKGMNGRFSLIDLKFERD